MSQSRTLETHRSTGTGREKIEDLAVQFPSAGEDRLPAVIGMLEETVTYDQFTDGGAAVGTYQMTGSIPAGAVLLGTKVTVEAGFAGDTSAVLIIGDGSDTDRYMTGTPSVFATAADGIQTGVVSGNKLITAANRPTLTVTSGADWGSVSAGQLTVRIYYIDA